MRRKWTQEELILCFKLYCEIPFGKFHQRNPEIVNFAEKIDRTPSAVAMKLCNFASFDPELKQKGMENSGKKDKEIFDRFYKKYKELLLEIERIIIKRPHLHQIEKEIEYTDKEGKTVKREVKTRINQEFFRRSVVSAYEGSCAITRLNLKELLIASHIIPWSEDKENRINPCNGICFNAFHDRVFDKGLMTIDEKYKVVFSQKILEEKNNDTFNYFIKPFDGKKIFIPERFKPEQKFLEYHRKNIFID